MADQTMVDAATDSTDDGALEDSSGECSTMEPMAEWVAAHALWLWTLLLLLALLVGDQAWQFNARWNQHAGTRGDPPVFVRLQVGLALTLALVLLFATIAVDISARQPGKLPTFDADLAEQLRAQLPPSALRVIALVTHLGDRLWIVPASAVIALVLLLRKHVRLATAWIVALLGILPINGGLKALFHRARPLHNHGFIVEPGWSFPSGHAFGSMVFYGMLAYVLLRLSPRCHRAIIAGAVLSIGVVGISRILLQVHYFSDVMAGYTAGATWLVLCITGAEYLRPPVPEPSP